MRINFNVTSLTIMIRLYRICKPDVRLFFEVRVRDALVGKILSEKGWSGFQRSICKHVKRKRFLPLLAFLVKPNSPKEIPSIPVKWTDKKTLVQAPQRTCNGLFEILLLGVRCLVIWCIVVQLLVLFPLSRVHDRCKQIWWKIVLRAIQFFGPIFVKFGQWASTRRDIFPAEMCQCLSTLQHQTHPHPWLKTVEILNTELGTSWRDVFFFDGPLEPVGSGCVAQVYKMYVKPTQVALPLGHRCMSVGKCTSTCVHNANTGKEDPVPVAVKVLHPNIHAYFERDTRILNHLASSIQFICPWLKWMSLVECVQEFCNFMTSQIDLEREAYYLEKFSENFGRESYIHFPYPVYPFVTTKVLVETWEEGELIGKYLDTKNIEVRKRLSDLIVHSILKMTFIDNLVHGDLHPGNILVQNSCLKECMSEAVLDDVCDIAILNFVTKPTSKTSLQIVILDCGLSTALSNKDFGNFFQVFKAIVLGQGEEVGKLFLKHSINECQNPEKFVKGMEDLVTKFRQNTLKLDAVDVGKLLGSVFDILTKHKVKLESNFSSIMMAIIILEGLGRSLDPEKDLLKDARRYLLNF